MTNPYQVFDEAQKFLNIGNYLKKDHFVINNKTGFYCVKRPEKLSETVCLPSSKGRTRGKTSNYTLITDKHRKQLETFFAPFNQELCSLVGKTMKFYKHLC